MKIFSALFLTTILFFQAGAQDKYGPGYYVTNNGDTVHGYVEYRTNYKAGVRFRTDLKTRPQQLAIDDVKAFGLSSGATYTRVNHPSKENPSGSSIFIRPMVLGEVDLYSYRGKMIIGSANKGRFQLVSKTSNDAEAMKNFQNNIGAFNILFQDCPAVKEEAQKVSVTQDRVIELIRSYHNCRGVSYQEFKTIKPKRIINVGLFVGQNIAAFSIGKPRSFSESSYLYNSNFKNSSSPTFGISALFPTRSPSPVFALQTGLAFSKGDHSATTSFSDPDFNGVAIAQTSATTVSYSKVAISAGLRLSVRSNKVNPYLGFGLATHQFLSLKENIHLVTTINTSVEEEDRSLGMEKSSFGVYGVAGLQKKIGSRKLIYAECNYENTFVTIDDPESAKVTGTSFRVGFLF
jgi:hypothetical protein